MAKRFMVIEARNIQGFYSNFLHTLQYLHSSEIENRIPIVYWTGGIYADKERYRGVKNNIWEYYFHRVSKYSIKDIDIKGSNVKRVSKYRNKSLDSEPEYCWDYRKMPPENCLHNPSAESRKYVNSLIEKYVVIREEIQQKIDDFYNKHIKGNNVLGVHVRHCKDHPNYLVKNALQKVSKSVNEYINENPDAKIFIATDWVKVINYMEGEFKNRLIYTKSKRSKNGDPLQYGCKPKKLHSPAGALAGEEVIIDCKLLSLCSELHCGMSNVSSVALYFNPNIKHKCIFI